MTLREAREQKCWSRIDLANHAAVSHRTVFSIEKTPGHRARMDVRRKLLDALGIDLERHFEVFGPLPTRRDREVTE